MEAPLAIPSYGKRFAAPRGPVNVGWISRRRNPTFEWVGAVAVLGRWMSPFRGKRRKRLWRFHHTESDPSYRDAVLGRWMSPVRGKRRKRLRRFRHTDADPPCIDSPPPNSKTPRTKARRLVCSGGYNRFAVNDGLRFANPSYELIRLTACHHTESDPSYRDDPPYRVDYWQF